MDKIKEQWTKEHTMIYAKYLLQDLDIPDTYENRLKVWEFFRDQKRLIYGKGYNTGKEIGIIIGAKKGDL